MNTPLPMPTSLAPAKPSLLKHGLFLDTSTDVMLLALIQEKSLVASSIHPHQNQLSLSLLPTLQKLLDEASLKPADLDYIAIGIGPGSYTGTRIGAACGKSLAFALSLPTLGLPSPLAFLPVEKGSFALILPFNQAAGQKGHYLLKGYKEEKDLPEYSVHWAYSLEELIPLLQEVESILSSDIPSLQALLASHLEKKIWLPSQPNLPFLAAYLPRHLQKNPPSSAPFKLQYFHNISPSGHF